MTKVGKTGSSNMVEAPRQAHNLISLLLFLLRTVRAICFREQACQFPCSLFVVTAVCGNVCAKRLSAPTGLEHRPVWGEAELSCKVHTFSLPSKSSKNLSSSGSISVSITFSQCKKGHMICPCPGVILGVLKSSRIFLPRFVS